MNRHKSSRPKSTVHHPQPVRRASLAPWLSPDESSAAVGRTPPWPRRENDDHDALRGCDHGVSTMVTKMRGNF